MKRPLVAVVVAYGTGLLLAQWLHPPLWWLGAPALVLAPALFIRRTQLYALWPLLALLGAINFQARTTALSPVDLRQVLGSEPALATVRGFLLETPRLKIVTRNGQEKWRCVARLRVREIRLAGSYQPADGEVLVNTPQVLPDIFFAGQPVEVSGVVAPPPGPLAPGLFDFRQYLAARGIYFQLKADSTNDWVLREPHATRPPLADRFLDWSRRTLALGLPDEDENLRLIWAMTLGWRTAFTGDIDEPFLQAGTMHIFAIDGLRIALVCGIIVALARLVRLPRACCGLVAMPIFWFYTAATGWEASAVRASVMMSVVLVGWMLKRPGDLLNSLAAAALILLAADPRQLLQASFLLSFFVMLIIALMLPPLNALSDRWIDRWIKPDPLIPDELVPGWRRKAVSWSRHFAHFAALSLVSWIGCLPLAAKFFHLFSPVSTPANVAAVPLGGFALAANLGALVCGHWLPWLTILFNHAGWFLMAAMTWVSVEAARLPGAYYYVPEPSTAAIVTYYIVVVAALSGWFNTRWRKILGAAILAMIMAVAGWQWLASRAEVRLTVLPVSGGHAVYVDAAGRHDDWLVNCGSEDAVDYTLKDFLRGQGVNFVPRLVLADASARDCGGARRVDELFGVGELWTGNARFRSPAYREAVAGFEKRAGGSAGSSPAAANRHRLFQSGQTNGWWRVLSSEPGAGVAKAGDASLVLRGDFPGARVLLLPDLNRTGQSELLAHGGDLRADILIAGLPDEGEPLCDALLAAVQPRAIIIADSEYPASRRAGRALQERLERSGTPVFFTRSTGAVTILVRDAHWRLQTMDGHALEGTSP